MAIFTDMLVAHARAVVRILTAGAGQMNLVIDTLTRVMLESASQAWWLADGRIGGRCRVARLAVVRRQTAVAYEKTIDRMGGTATSGYGRTVAEIQDEYETRLGLVADYGRRGGWKGYEGEPAMEYGRGSRC